MLLLLYGTGIKRSCNSPPITFIDEEKERERKIESKIEKLREEEKHRYIYDEIGVNIFKKCQF